MNLFRQMLVSATGALAIAACGAGSDNAPDTQNPPSPASSDEASPKVISESGAACPLALPGITSSVEDTVDGVVVLFATPRPGDAAELRRRVERLADAHENMAAAGAGNTSPAPPQGPGPRESAAAPAGNGVDATASVEATETEVRLVLRPRDPARLDASRDALRKRADELVQGACKQAGRKTDH